MSIDVNPYTAFVTWPVFVASSGGNAKNARYASEWPSSKRIAGRSPADAGNSRGGAAARLGLTSGEATVGVRARSKYRAMRATPTARVRLHRHTGEKDPTPWVALS